MQYILLIDTSGSLATVTLSVDGLLGPVRTNTEARNHASAINVMIDDVLDEAGINFAALSGVAVCGGPGSYTGLRIGVATAKGLCYALGVPLLLHHRLYLLARQHWAANGTRYAHYATVLTAREGEYYAALYDRNLNCLLEPQHIYEAAFLEILKSKENLYIITDVQEPANYCLKVNNSYLHITVNLDLKSWAFYANEKYNSGIYADLAHSEPFYLKQVYTHN